MTTFNLKFIALIFMLIDHTGQFISYASLFVFTMVEGFKYTCNGKGY